MHNVLCVVHWVGFSRHDVHAKPLITVYAVINRNRGSEMQPVSSKLGVIDNPLNFVIIQRILTKVLLNWSLNIRICCLACFIPVAGSSF